MIESQSGNELKRSFKHDLQQAGLNETQAEEIITQLTEIEKVVAEIRALRIASYVAAGTRATVATIVPTLLASSAAPIQIGATFGATFFANTLTHKAIFPILAKQEPESVEDLQQAINILKDLISNNLRIEIYDKLKEILGKAEENVNNHFNQRKADVSYFKEVFHTCGAEKGLGLLITNPYIAFAATLAAALSPVANTDINIMGSTPNLGLRRRTNRGNDMIGS